MPGNNIENICLNGKNLKKEDVLKIIDEKGYLSGRVAMNLGSGNCIISSKQ